MQLCMPRTFRVKYAMGGGRASGTKSLFVFGRNCRGILDARVPKP